MSRTSVDSLLARMGMILQKERERMGLGIATMASHHGPAEATCRQIESGRIRNLTPVLKYLDVVGVDLADVIVMLAEEIAGKVTISPRLSAVARQYEQTTEDGRRLIEGVAKLCPRELPALAERRRAAAEAPTEHVGQTPPSKRSTRRAKRR